MHKQVVVGSILPNPFRYMDRYPIDEEKIESLIGSMERTGFWDNVVARQRSGKTELAYGHHRWIAFKRKYGKKALMNLVIRDLSDEDMLRVMADENANEYGHSAEVEQETIRAVVQAYADGKIELEKPKPMGKGGFKAVRMAPKFAVIKFKGVKFNPEDKPYNAESIARFLQGSTKHGRWMCGKQVSPHVRTALAALEAVEAGLVEAKDYTGLSRNQAQVIQSEATGIARTYEQAAKEQPPPKRKAHIERGKTIAKRTAKTVAEKMRREKKKGGGIGVREARDEMRKARIKSKKSIDKKVPEIEKFVSKLTRDIEVILEEKDPKRVKLDEVVKYREHIDEWIVNNLTVALGRLIDRCQAIIKCLEGTKPKPKPKLERS